MFWEPVLKAIPTAVMFGVFLYLGVSALSGVQMYKRIKLLLIPVKYHPSRGFVRRVGIKYSVEFIGFVYNELHQYLSLQC